MSHESAWQFLDEARQNRAFRMAVQEYLLSRDVHKLVNFGQERGFEFTAAEIKRAVDAYWDISDPARQQEFVAEADPTHYVLHPINQKYLAGQRRRPVLRYEGSLLWQRMVLIVISTCLILVLASPIVNSYWRDFELHRHGVVTQGKIVSRDEKRVFTWRTYIGRYFVTVHFRVNDKQYRLKQEVNGFDYNDLQEGRTVDILYSSQNPRVAKLGDSDILPLWTLLGWAFVLFFGSVLLILGWTILRDYRRERSYGKNGQVLEGKITSVKARVLPNGQGLNFATTFEIAFVSPDSQTPITQSIFCQFTGLRANVPPKQGKVSILYVDADHWWVL